MYLGFEKTENGEFKKKWVKDEDLGKDPNVFHKVASELGDYVVAGPNGIEEAKELLLEKMINAIRSVAKMDEFWIVKTATDADYEEYRNSVLYEFTRMTKEEWLANQPEELRNGGAAVGVKIGLPQFDGYYSWEEAKAIEEKLADCMRK